MVQRAFRKLLGVTVDAVSRALLMTGGGAGLTPFEASPGNYALVPINSTLNTNPNTLLVLNTNTGLVEHSVAVSTISSYRYRVMRFGKYLVQFFETGGYASYNTETGGLVDSGFILGRTSATTATLDAVKFADDKFAVVYPLSNYLRGSTYLVTNGVVSLIATSGALVYHPSNLPGYASPQIAAQLTLNSEAVLASFTGRISYVAPYYYDPENAPGVIQSISGQMNVTSGGVTTALTSSILDGFNFSRPYGATGDNNFNLIGNFDGSQSWNFSGTSFGSWVTFNNAANNYAPSGVHGSSGVFMKDVWNGSGIVIQRNTTNTITTDVTYTFSANPRGSMQLVKGGCVWVYGDTDDGNKLKYRKYDRVSNTWGSPVLVAGYTGTVNFDYRLSKVMMY